MPRRKSFEVVGLRRRGKHVTLRAAAAAAAAAPGSDSDKYSSSVTVEVSQLNWATRQRAMLFADYRQVTELWESFRAETARYRNSKP